MEVSHFLRVWRVKSNAEFVKEDAVKNSNSVGRGDVKSILD